MNAKIQKLINDPGLTNRLAMLAERWSHEREYEDIAEYAKVLSKEPAMSAYKIVRMTKRPFGFVVNIDGLVAHVFAKMSRNSITIACRYQPAPVLRKV
jgi:hypothetical protein